MEAVWLSLTEDRWEVAAQSRPSHQNAKYFGNTPVRGRDGHFAFKIKHSGSWDEIGKFGRG
jgi:hypothetical protein